MNPSADAGGGGTELVLYILPGNVVRLIRVAKGCVFPGSDLLTPPDVRRIDNPTLPIDLKDPTWKVRLDEMVVDFPEEKAVLRQRIRVIYPKGQRPPPMEWVRMAVENTIYTLH